MAGVGRFVVLQLLLVWQGGFLFYTAVVVPVGTDVLGSAAAQGVITTRVTDWLNRLGTLTLIAAGVEIARTTDPSRRRAGCRWAAWGVMAAGQVALVYLHLVLDSLMTADRTAVAVRDRFYPTHRVYLWASTVQWAAGLALVWWTLRAWSAGGQPAGRP